MQMNSIAAVITFSLRGGVKVDKQAFCRVLGWAWRGLDVMGKVGLSVEGKGAESLMGDGKRQGGVWGGPVWSASGPVRYERSVFCCLTARLFALGWRLL